MKTYKAGGVEYTMDDIALAELLSDGSTVAPADTIQSLKASGYITTKNGVKLTAAGQRRAGKVQQHEATMRTFFNHNIGTSQRMTTAGAKPVMKITGGSVRIHG